MASSGCAVTSTLYVIAACTDKKRSQPTARQQLRNYKFGDSRSTQWLRSLEATTSTAVPAHELYVGNHWSAAREIPSVARTAGWARATLWVASAGYGLLDSNTKVVPYAATFATGHADSVVDPSSGDEPGLQCRNWWQKLNVGRGNAPAFHSESSGAACLFVGSRAYVEAATEHLLSTARTMTDPSRLVIVTGALPKNPLLREHAVLPPARLRSIVGGPLTSLHARWASYLVSQIKPDEWSLARVRALTDSAAKTATIPDVPQREPMSDAEVRTFVRDAIRATPSAKHSTLLRELRLRGNACEQSRFKQLFLEVKES